MNEGWADQNSTYEADSDGANNSNSNDTSSNGQVSAADMTVDDLRGMSDSDQAKYEQ